MLNFYPRPPRGGRRTADATVKYTDDISIHALREEGDSSSALGASALPDFYPRPPRGGRLWTMHRMQTPKTDFYPRPPRGGRLTLVLSMMVSMIFLSTPSARRATASPVAFLSLLTFLSTPSARRATLSSIAKIFWMFSFLSTPSARRATSDIRIQRLPTNNFYPRPPRGGRQRGKRKRTGGKPISIHALREEGDFFAQSTVPKLATFLSTPSARRATPTSRAWNGCGAISIHALREEGDGICQ